MLATLYNDYNLPKCLTFCFATFHSSPSQNIQTGLTSKGHIGDASAPPLTSSVNMIMQTKKNRFYTNSDTRVTGSGYAVL